MCPAVELPIGEARVGRVISFPASPARSATKRNLLEPSVVELVESIATILERLVLSALDKRTLKEFIAARDEVFPKYFEAMHALSSLATIVLPPQALDRLSGEFFSEMEADCRDHAEAAFGADVRDQWMFTIWTLRKIADLGRAITAAPLLPELKKQDREIAVRFSVSSTWARFHLDCLQKSMETKRPIYPEVHEEVIEGLRSAVNAYAWARQGLELRSPMEEDLGAATPGWDEEDQQLLNEATCEQVGEA